MFRYIVPVKDQNIKEKIIRISLFGGAEPVTDLSSVDSGEFNGMTTDINQHRNKGSNHLYLIWKSVKTT